MLVLYEELIPSSFLNEISFPSLFPPLSSRLEIKKLSPPEGLDRGFRVSILSGFNFIVR